MLETYVCQASLATRASVPSKLLWDMAELPEIGATIKALLEAHRMSQSKLGRLVGVQRAAVGQWIKGQNYPSLSNLIEISRIFNVSLSVFGDPEIEKPKIDAQLDLLPPELSDFYIRQFNAELKRAKKIGKVGG